MGEKDNRAWKLITAVPRMAALPAYGCATANLIISGLGTIICAFSTDRNVNKTQLLVGITQFLLSVYIIGYIASIYWAWLFI